jgi:hypothetical protein
MINVDNKVKNLANRARKSISKYCYEECNAYCCQKGYLTLTDKELSLVLKDKLVEYCLNGQVTETDLGYSFFMGKPDHYCPCLVDNKCTIHKSKLRPQCCKDFPIFIDYKNKLIKLSPRCFAVKERKLYGYEAEFIRLGFKLST